MACTLQLLALTLISQILPTQNELIYLTNFIYYVSCYNYLFPGATRDKYFQSKGSINALISTCTSFQERIAANPSYLDTAKKVVRDNILKSFLQELSSRKDEKGLILLQKRPEVIKKYICALLLKKEIIKSFSKTRKLKYGYLESTGHEIMVHIISHRAWDAYHSKKTYIISHVKKAFKLAVFTSVCNQLPDHVQMWWGKKKKVSFSNYNHRNEYDIII